MRTSRILGSKLTGDARPSHVYDYMVTGSGDFPYDMLRYDAAWPVDTGSAMRIPGHDKRSVILRSHLPPTDDRWRSFLWLVEALPEG